MLSDRFIRNAKPGTYADEGGLYLRVLSTSRSFLWRRKEDGKDRWETIGRYPEMSLLEAREVIAKRKRGVVDRTVSEAFGYYYEHLSKEYATPGQTKRMFEADVAPRLGKKDLASLDRAEWMRVITAVVDRGAPVMANRLLTQMKRFLDYCEQHGWLDDNPLEKVKRRVVGGKETPKDRNLSWDEIEGLLAALPKWGISDGTRWAFVGCLLTGLRATEVLTITDDGRAFTKMQRWHQIPLTPTTRLWLSKRPTELPRDHRVLSHALRRLEQTFTPHDLRRTFASRLSDLGVAPHTIEKMLDHKMVGVMSVYNRAEYWPERYAAQRAWDWALLKKRPRRKTGA